MRMENTASFNATFFQVCNIKSKIFYVLKVVPGSEYLRL
jgi:hypothetical protein